ncbi:MAG: hypothetical protein WBD20_27775 [Pirellulaceae bacterium]
MTQRSFDDVSVELRSQGKPTDQPPGDRPELNDVLRRGGLFDRVDPIGTESVSAWSIGGGLMGLGAAIFLIGAVSGWGRFWLDDQILNGGLLSVYREVVYLQLVYTPIAMASATVLVVTMFWYPSVILRFVVAILILIPGTEAYFATHYLASGHRLMKYYFGVDAMLMSFFVGAAVVGLTAQMMTRWELTHLQYGQRSRRVIGIPMLMELTGVAALAYALFRVLEGGQMSLQNGQFLLLGFLCSLPVLSGCFLILRPGCDKSIALVAFLCTASLASYVCVALRVVPEFGAKVLRNEFGSILVVSAIGTSIILLTTSASLIWLRFCGWNCRR